MSAPDIFLSYNREDAAVAKLYADTFAAAGMEVWWDVTLRSGEAYDKVTEAALRGAKAVVVLWSPRSVDLRWVRAEASIADEKGTMAPAMIEACDLPVMFRLTQTPNLTHWRGAGDDKAWQAFLGDVRRMVGQNEGTPALVAAPSPASAAGGMPIVAVLPITHRAGDEDIEILAEDLTEDITRELAHSQYCKVIAAGTMAVWRGKPIDHRALGREVEASYLVEGKLQRTGENARLTVQLIDSATGSMLWSERITRRLADIEATPEEFPVAMAGELGQSIGQFEMNRAMTKAGPFSAWEHILRVRAHQARMGSQSNRSAVEEARKAVAKAPDFGMAYATLAGSLTGFAALERGALSEAERHELLREARDHSKRAMELDGDNSAVLILLAAAYASLGDAEAGLRLAQRAAKLAPYSAEAHNSLGFTYFMLGRTADAIAAYGKQVRLAPFDAFRPGALAALGICLFIEGRPIEAEEAPRPVAGAASGQLSGAEVEGRRRGGTWQGTGGKCRRKSDARSRAGQGDRRLFGFADAASGRTSAQIRGH